MRQERGTLFHKIESVTPDEASAVFHRIPQKEPSSRETRSLEVLPTSESIRDAIREQLRKNHSELLRKDPEARGKYDIESALISDLDIAVSKNEKEDTEKLRELALLYSRHQRKSLPDFTLAQKKLLEMADAERSSIEFRGDADEIRRRSEIAEENAEMFEHIAEGIKLEVESDEDDGIFNNLPSIERLFSHALRDAMLGRAKPKTHNIAESRLTNIRVIRDALYYLKFFPIRAQNESRWKKRSEKRK